MTRSRNAFTLVELLVVMSLIAVLATLTIAFFPSVTTSAREARAATMLQSWLNIAKQRALRDQAPGGLRLLRDPLAPPGKLQVVECQYIAQPDDYCVGKLFHPQLPIQSATVSGNVVTVTANGHGRNVGDMMGISGVSPPGYNGSYPILAAPAPTANTFSYAISTPPLSPGTGGNVAWLNLLSFDTADLVNGYTPGYPGTPNNADPNAKYWAVIPGDYLEVNGTGLLHRVTNVRASNLIDVSPPLPYTISPQVKATYRIIRAPRVAGDETLKLPSSTLIDLDTNLPNPTGFNNPLPTGALGDVDILFAPSGQVISRGIATDKIHLWVRSSDVQNPPFGGDPTLVSIFVRTGFVGAYAPDKTNANPYILVK